MIDITLQFDQQADGTSTITGTIEDTTASLMINNYFSVFTIHEFGDTSDNCINIGNEIVSTLDDAESKIAS